jgi:HAD superfamily hydrolase (TIGR01490 family)
MTQSSRTAAFFDLDNTLIRGSSLFYLARGLFKLKFFSSKDMWAFIWKQAKFVVVGKEHINDMQFIKSVGLRIAAGHSIESLVNIADGVVEQYLVPKVYQQTVELAKTHLQRGEEVWIVTAAPNRLANVLASKLGFTGALGTHAEEVDGCFTGELVGKPLHGPEKAVAIRELAERTGLDLAGSSAYSDSVYDLPLLQAVGNPNVVNGDRQLRAIAKKEGWRQYDFRRLRHARRYGGQTVVAALAALFMRNRRNKKG